MHVIKAMVLDEIIVNLSSKLSLVLRFKLHVPFSDAHRNITYFYQDS